MATYYPPTKVNMPCIIKGVSGTIVGMSKKDDWMLIEVSRFDMPKDHEFYIWMTTHKTETWILQITTSLNDPEVIILRSDEELRYDEYLKALEQERIDEDCQQSQDLERWGQVWETTQ